MHVYDSSKTAARFWRKVDRSGDCWLWTAGVDRRGYGRFNVGDGRRGDLAQLARTYGVTHGAITQIRSGQRWRHLSTH
jgi:hypothetical protein